MSDDQDQLEFAADDARHSSPTPCSLGCHEAMDSIEELKEFIKKQEREVARLRTLADNYQSARTKSLAEMTDDRDYWKATAESHKKHMDILNSTHARLIADRDAHKGSADSLTADLKTSNDVNDRLKLEISQLHSSLRAMTVSRNEWSEKAESREVKLADSAMAVATLQVKVNDLECHIAELKRSHVSRESAEVIGKLTLEINELKDVASKRGYEIGCLKAKNQSLCNSLAEVIKHREGLLKSQDADRKSINEKYKEIEELTKSLKGMADDRDWWRTAEKNGNRMLGEQSAKITDLERSLTSTKSANEYLKRDLEEANAENSEQIKTIKGQAETISRLDAQLSSLGATADDLENQVKRLTDEKQDQKSLIERHYDVMSIQSGQIDEQAKQIKTLQDGLEDMRARYIAAQKSRVEMGQFHPGFGTDSVVIPKDELRDRLNSLRMADPAFASWHSLRDMTLSITRYFEEKIGQKS